MTFPASFVAAAINARLSPVLRRRLQSHAGASVAVRIGFLRMCFRLTERGQWRAASPLTDADAEMRASFANGEFSVQGGGELLRDLDEVRRQCSPQTIAEELFGAESADRLRRTAESAAANLRDFPVQCKIAASAAEVSEFVRQTAAFDSATAAAETRLSRLSRKTRISRKAEKTEKPENRQ